MKAIVIAFSAFVCLTSVESNRRIRSYFLAEATALECMANKNILKYAEKDEDYDVNVELIRFALKLKKSNGREEDQKAVDEFIKNFCTFGTRIHTQIDVAEKLRDIRESCESAMNECGTKFMNKL